jgi:hypothetical protein
VVATEKRRPSKAEFVRSFDRSIGGILPECVVDTVDAVYAMFLAIADHFETPRLPRPRRLRRAMARFDGNDLASFYDTGTLARIRWYYARHLASVERGLLQTV